MVILSLWKVGEALRIFVSWDDGYLEVAELKSTLHPDGKTVHRSFSFLQAVSIVNAVKALTFLS